MRFDSFSDYAFPISSGHPTAVLQEGPASAWREQPVVAFVAQPQDHEPGWRRGAQLPSAVILAQEMFKEKRKIN